MIISAIGKVKAGGWYEEGGVSALLNKVIGECH